MAWCFFHFCLPTSFYSPVLLQHRFADTAIFFATAIQPTLTIHTLPILFQNTFRIQTRVCVCPDYKYADPLRHCLKAFHYLKMHLSTVCSISKCLRLNNEIANTQKPLGGIWSIRRSFQKVFCSTVVCAAATFSKGLDVKNVTERQGTVLLTQLRCCATHWIYSVGSKEVKGLHQTIISLASQD